MKKFVTFVATFACVMLVAAVAMAQEPTDLKTITVPVVDFSKYFGAALTTMGAAYGIGKLASSALESMARQPEVAGSIQTAMIIAAALIEGFTFFALVICFT